MPILAQVTEYMERPDEQVVVLFQILAAEINFGYKFQCVRCAAASKLQDWLCIATGCMMPRRSCTAVAWGCRPATSVSLPLVWVPCMLCLCQLTGCAAATLVHAVLHM